MKVMLTGGTGFVGGRIAHRLMERGDHVALLARDPARASELKTLGAEVIAGDLSDTRSLSTAAAGCDAVIHAAGVTQPAKRSVFESVHVDGTRTVVEAAQSAGVRRLIHIASDAVVFSGKDLIGIDESRPYPERFIDPYSETKARGEQLALAAHITGGLEVISLRPGVVWGRGDTTVLPIMAKLSSGLFGIPAIGAGLNLESTSHIENVASAVLAALDAERALGRAYFLPDGFRVGWREFLVSQMEAVGIRPKFFTVPGGLAVPAAAMVDKAADGLGLTIPLASFGMTSAMTTRSYATTAARDDFGHTPTVGFEEGLADLAQWVEEIGGPEVLIKHARI